MRGDDGAAFSLAFEGCGCRAAFQVGVIEWFTEHLLHAKPAATAPARSPARQC